MEEYIGYIIIVVMLSAILFIMYQIEPVSRRAILNTLLEFVKEKEPWIVMAVYNRLPTKLKDIGSKQIASIIGFIIDELIDLIKRDMKM